MITDLNNMYRNHNRRNYIMESLQLIIIIRIIVKQKLVLSQFNKFVFT